MTFDQNLVSATISFPVLSDPAAHTGAEDALAAFEDRLWRTAEAIISSGASSISVVAETASLVRRHSATFASILSGADYFTSLGEDAGPLCQRALFSDIAAAEERLVSQLRQDLEDL